MDQNKFVLITGASAGIGFEMARIFSARGYSLILASRNLKKLEEVKKEMESLYRVKVFIISADLSKADAAEKLYFEIEKMGISVEILVNNAGSGLIGESVEKNTHEIENMLTLNILSLTTLCNLFGKKMKERGSGKILNVGSLIGFYPVPWFSSYAASKSYVLSYSIALRSELKSYGIVVTCLLPGFVKTNFDDNAGITSSKYKKYSNSNSTPPGKVAATGVKALFAGKAFVVAGFGNKILRLLSSAMPRKTIAGLFKSFISGMLK